MCCQAQFVGALTSKAVSLTNLQTVFASLVHCDQLLKGFAVLLSGQPCLDLRNIDTQPVSDPRGANTVHVELRHERDLLLRRQSAITGITHGRVRTSVIDNLHVLFRG